MMNKALNIHYAKSVFSKLKRWNEKQAFQRKHQLAFLGNLAMLTDGGHALNRALRALSQIGSARKIERKVASEIADRVTRGEPVHLAMEDWFDADIAAAFSVGQHHSGAQADLTNSLIERSNWLNEIKKEPVKANSYLIFTAIMSIGAMLFFGLKILPELTNRMTADEIPLVAQSVMSVSLFLANFGLVLLIAAGGLVAFTMQKLKNSSGSYRIDVLDSAWPFSIYKQLTAFSYFSQLLKMIQWGDTPLQAAEKIKSYSPPYVKYFMGLISERASNGVSDINELFDIELLSPAVKGQIQLASKTENSAATNDVLRRIPVVLRVETKSMMIKLKRIITAFLLVFVVALLLGVFFSYLSVYSQIISTTTIGY